MSVRDRLTDAQVLYSNGRKEGALLSVLVAVAATSKKRYPSGIKNDSDAFKSLLAEELPRAIGVGKFSVKYRGSMILLQDLLYKYIRCVLTHEAELPDDILFEPSDMLSVNVADESITFSDRLIDVLATIVRNARENEHEFRGN
jgi:hypothetical protein